MRRATSTSDTLRSTRSEASQSPRVARSHHSVSTPSPATPPLARTPHRHSISHAPPSLEASARPRGTVIAVTTPPQPATRPRTASRESAGERDSGNPSPDVTAGSGRASRSPALQGSEGSMEFDSLSVDDSVEEASVGATTAAALATAATTVIHVTGNSVSRTREEAPELAAAPARRMPEVSSGPPSSSGSEGSRYGSPPLSAVPTPL